MSSPADETRQAQRTRVTFLHVGSSRNGVTRFGLVLSEAVAAHRDVGHVRCDRLGDLDGRAQADPAGVWHVQYSSHAHDLDAERSAQVLAQLSRRVGLTMVVTLHDVPDVTAEHGPRARGRARAYARVAAEAQVVVCSTTERNRLAALGHRRRVEVIPHFVERRPGTTGPRPSGRHRDGGGRARVGVLGFVYPGKGHDTVLEAAARCRSDVEVVVIGAASPGHDDLLAELRARAARSDVALTVTGWVPERRLDDALVAVDVAVVAHRGASASGSAATWLAAGRRPILCEDAYARELARLAPTAVRLVARDETALAAAIDAALDDPGSTRQSSVPPELRIEAIAGRYGAVYDRAGRAGAPS